MSDGKIFLIKLMGNMEYMGLDTHFYLPTSWKLFLYETNPFWANHCMEKRNYGWKVADEHSTMHLVSGKEAIGS